MFGATPHLSDVFVANTEQFSIADSIYVVRIVADNLFEFNDMFEFFEEEHVDFSSIVHHTEVDAKTNELSNSIEAVVGSSADIFEETSCVPIVEFLVIDVANTSFEWTHSFEERFFKRTTHAHHLTRSLHLSAEGVLSSSELVEWETSNFSNHIVESRFERSRSVSNLDFVEAKANGDFSTNASDRVTASFRSKSWRTAHARVHLDEVVVERVRVECILHVTTTFDLQFANDFESRVAEELILFVSKSLRRTNNDRVASVDADRVDVFHITDSDSSVVSIAHHFVFDFFEAFDTLFYEHLVYRRKSEGIAHDFAEFLFVVGKTTTSTTESKCRAKYNRITDFFGSFETLFHIVGNDRR